jgi:hypothetical protein
MCRRSNAAIACALAPFLSPLACTLRNASPTTEKGDTTPPDDSAVPAGDDSSADDSCAQGDDSSAPDDSSATSSRIEWTLVDSTNGPISHQWANCDPHKCEDGKPAFCGGAEVGIVTSQDELAMLYAESLRGLDYVPEVDFSSQLVVWSYLCCCTPVTEWLVVDDVTRVGLTLELSMHVESFELGPATFGRPWVVVQVPIGEYDGVVHNLY